MNLANYIEHTILKPNATNEEIEKLLKEAKTYNFKGVCVNPINVKKAKNYLKETPTKIVTVVGFPLGASLPESKAFEAKKAIEDGADEIDMVICVQEIKNKNYEYVKNDIATVKKACGEIILKVIIETDLLTKEEIIKASELCIEANADFVKTSTGFVKDGVGAKIEDVKTIKEVIKSTSLQIKASGGIKDKEKAQKLVEAGASRLGTSSGVTLIS